MLCRYNVRRVNSGANYMSLLGSGHSDAIENVKDRINLCDALYFVLLQFEFPTKLSMRSIVLNRWLRMLKLKCGTTK